MKNTGNELGPAFEDPWGGDQNAATTPGLTAWSLGLGPGFESIALVPLL